MPWLIAMALIRDGWYLRSDIIWAKPNPMPESVTDRPTKAHEYIFLLTKSARYWYDADAIREGAEYGYRECSGRPKAGRNAQSSATFRGAGDKNGIDRGSRTVSGKNPDTGRNARTVWTIPTQPYPEAHFATFPEEIPRRCIRAGCPKGGTVLDPFAGSGTTIAVAIQEGREGIGIELNPKYAALASERIQRAETGVTEKEQRSGQMSLIDT